MIIVVSDAVSTSPLKRSFTLPSAPVSVTVMASAAAKASPTFAFSSFDNAFAEPLNLAVVERLMLPSVCGGGVCFPCCGIA